MDTFLKTANQLLMQRKVVADRFDKRPYHPKVEAAIFCYKHIFPNTSHAHLETVNDTYLDFETAVQPSNNILVRQGKDTYAFQPKEIVDIFHSDLSSSTAEVVPGFHACTLKMTFRLPRNPYTNKTFTLEQLDSILAQMILTRTIHNVLKHPEIPIFFLNRHKLILQGQQQQAKYKTTKHIGEVLEQNGLQFIQRYKYNSHTHDCDNSSSWRFSGKLDLHQVTLLLMESLS